MSDRIGSLWVEERYRGRVLPLRGTAARPLPDNVRAAAVEALGEHERTPPTRGLVGLREVAIARSHGLAIVADEAYERFVYDGARIASVAERRPDAVLVRSIGKSYALPTRRLGYVVGARPFIDAAVRALELDCIRCPYVGQRVAQAGIPAVPGRFFQAPGYARVPFGGDVATVAEALRDWSQSRSSVRT